MIAADSVVGACGVNVHSVYGVGNPTNAYAQSGWELLPASLGMRHVRDNPDFSLSPASGHVAATVAAQQAIVATGCDMGDILSAYDGNLGAAALTALTNYVAAGMPIPVSLEGYQEVNFYWANWFASQAAGIAAVQAFQPSLYGAKTSYPGYPGLAILGPSLAGLLSQATVGNLEPNLDFVNQHAYHTGAAAPEAFNGYYAAFVAANNTGPDKATWFTETGLSSGSDPTTAWCTELCAARLYPRMILNAVARGVQRVYFYELLDEHATANTNYQDRFGLFHFDMTPKQQATAVGNMLGLLADPGPAFVAPADLPLVVSGGSATTATMQMAKRNGDVWVAVWEPGQVVTNPNANGSPYITGSDLADTNLPTVVTVPGAYRAANIYRPMVSASPSATYSERKAEWPVDVLADSATVGLLSQYDVTLVELVR